MWAKDLLKMAKVYCEFRIQKYGSSFSQIVHNTDLCVSCPAIFSRIDFLSKRAGYDGQERAHGGLELCDQERQKDLQGQRAAGGRRQGLVFGNLGLANINL